MNKDYTKEFKQDVLKTLYECGGHHLNAARKLQLSVSVVMHVDMIENGAFNYTPEGQGREELKPYLVAVKKRYDQWDNDDAKIHFARVKYNEGLVEMTQARDGFNDLLYAIPRQEPETTRKPYFEFELPSNIAKIGAY